ANPWTFVNVDDKELKLWKVDITFVGPNKKLKIIENKVCAVIKERLEGMRLFPFNKINEYFFEVSEKNHLSTIIERPQVIKSTSSLE
ncbi:210_t:CDS:1, partial [Gigaspora rosea]